MGDDFNLSGLLGGAGAAASAILPYTMSQEAIDQLKTMGTELGARAPQIAQQAAQASEFQPFTVTTGLGTTEVGPQGGFTTQLTEPQQAIQEGLLGQAQTAMGTTQVSPEDLYGQLQSLRQPTIDRQRLALENRLMAQGRIGTQSGMFGGSTPEQLALEQSLREQEAADALTALTQAGALTGQNIENLTGMLGAAYVPQTQALNALTTAQPLAQIAQLGRQGESEALYKGGIAGLETEAAGLTGAANLEAARTQALGNTLGQFFGVQMNEGQTSSPYQQLLDLLGFGQSNDSAANQALDAVDQYL